MMFRTHLAIGFLTGLFLIPIAGPDNAILFMMLILFGSALPDIDHPESKIGRKVKVIALLFEHRGFFHSLFAALLLFLLVAHYLHAPVYGVYIFALTAGYLTHILSDSITREGIMPFHPISKFRVNGFIMTGKIAEHIILLVCICMSIIKLISLL